MTAAVLLLAAAAAQPLGLPFGQSLDRVQRAMAAAGIACKPASAGALDCPRAPEKIDGASSLRLEFADDRLSRAELRIDPGAKTFAAFRSRYAALKRQLTEKYGEPKASLEYVDSFYVLADEEYKATAIGKGEFTSTWKAGDLGAKLSLRGEGGEVRLTLSFGVKEDALR